MNAMTRLPRFRPILVVAALFALMVVPMTGARTIDSPAVHPAGESWIGVTLRWVEDLISPRRPEHSGSQVPPNLKSTIMVPNNGGCIDPTGHPKPWCL
jgi:hypothetical protein